MFFTVFEDDIKRDEAEAAAEEQAAAPAVPVIQVSDQERQTLIEKTEAARLAAVAAETERRAAEEMKAQVAKDKVKWEETIEAMKRALEAERCGHTVLINFLFAFIGCPLPCISRLT